MLQIVKHLSDALNEILVVYKDFVDALYLHHKQSWLYHAVCRESAVSLCATHVYPVCGTKQSGTHWQN